MKFLSSPVDISIGSDAAFTNVDLTTPLGGDAGAAGIAIVWFENVGASDVAIGLQHPDSTDDLTGDLSPGAGTQLFCGIRSADDIIQVYAETAASINVYLIGYTLAANGGFLINSANYTPSVDDEWRTQSINGDSGGGATLAFFQVKNTAPGGREFAMRPTGSTDTGMQSDIFDKHLVGAVMVLDGSEQFDCWCQDVSGSRIEVELIGWYTKSLTAKTDAFTWQGNSDSFSNQNLATELNPGDDGALIYMFDTGGGLSNGSVRKPGESVPTLVTPQRMTFALTALNGSQQVAYAGDGMDFYLYAGLSSAAPDTTPPLLDSAIGAGDEIDLTYDEALDESSVPAPGDFTVTGSSSGAITVSSVDVAGSLVELTLSAQMVQGETVTVDYTPGANPIRDIAENDAANLSSQAVTNNTGPLTVAQVETGEEVFTASQTTAAVTLGTTVDKSKTAVFIDVSVNGGGDAYNSHVQVDLSADGTTLNLNRGAGATPDEAITVRYNVVEFSQGATVQHITGSGGSVAEITKAAQDRSIILLSVENDAANLNGGSCADAVRFNSATEIEVLHSAGADTTNWTAQVIEFHDGTGVSVQQATINLVDGAANDLTDTATISAVDLPSTFVVGTMDVGGATWGLPEQYSFYWGFDDSTTVRVTRGDSRTNATAYLFVVDMENATPGIRRGTDSMSTGEGTLSHDIAGLNSTADSMAFRSGGMLHAGADFLSTAVSASSTRVSITDSVTLESERYGTGGTSGVLNWTVIDWSGKGTALAPVWPDDIHDGIDAMDENSLRAPSMIFFGNGNNWSNARTPSAQIPTAEKTPHNIFTAWPSTCLDTTNGKIVGHGGGHANYGGNEIYAADLVTMQFERVCLPSDVVEGPTNYWGSINGVDDAPAAAHQYANSTFLPHSGMMFVPGAAAYNTGGGYKDPAGNDAGPYIWDLSLSDPDGVGGADNTDVDAAATGLNGWTHLDRDVNTAIANLGQQEGCNVGVDESGTDVIYSVQQQGAGAGLDFIRTVISGAATNPANWTSTTFHSNPNVTPTYQAAFIPDYKGSGDRVMVCWLDNTGLTNSIYAYNWDTDTAHTITPSGSLAGDHNDYSMIYDPVRDRILVVSDEEWAEMDMPATFGTSGWSLSALNPTADDDYKAYSDLQDNLTYGKLHYWREYDVFLVTRVEENEPHVWLYKPTGWSPESGGTTVTIGQAAESSSAFAVSSGQVVEVGQASESTTATSVNSYFGTIWNTDIPDAVFDSEGTGDDNVLSRLGGADDFAVHEDVTIPGTTIRGVLNNTSEQFTVADSPELEPGTGAWTILFWIKTPNAGSPTIYHKVTGTNPFASPMEGLSIYQAATGILCRYGDGTNTSQIAANGVCDDTWHHVGFEFDVPSENVRSYVDGAQHQSASMPVSGMDISTTNLARFLYSVLGEVYNFPGSIAEVQLFNRILGEAEISTYMNGPRKLDTQGLDTVYRWQLDQVIQVDGIISPDTSTAHPVTAAKTVQVGQASETSTAQSVELGQNILVGQTTETDSVFGVTALKEYTTGQATEANSAFAVAGAQAVEVGQASSTETATSVTAIKTATVGLAQAASTAFAVTAAKSAQVGLATILSTSFAVDAAKAYEVGLPAEIDSAFSVEAPAANEVALAVEASNALSVASVKTLEIGQAASTESAPSVAYVKGLTVDQAGESSQAQPVSSSKAASAGQSGEMDTSQPVVSRKAQTVGQAGATESAFSVSAVTGSVAGTAAETDNAHPVSGLKELAVGQVQEAEQAQAVTFALTNDPINAGTLEGVLITSLGGSASVTVTPIPSTVTSEAVEEANVESTAVLP